MKKILILFLLFIPLFTNAQNWFTADAISVGVGSEIGEWYECNARVFTNNEGDVKVYTSDNTIVYRRIGENYTKDEDDNGMSMAWKCVDDEGQRCMLSFNSYEGFLWLMIEYEEFTAFYHLIPDD